MRARASQSRFIRPARKLHGTPMRVIYRSRFREETATIPASLALSPSRRSSAFTREITGTRGQFEATFARNFVRLEDLDRDPDGIPRKADSRHAKVIFIFVRATQITMIDTR